MASEASAPAHRESDEVDVIVKNPANTSVVDFKTTVSVSSTVGDLKARIRDEYEGHPPPSSQRLIFSGALLRDEGAKLADVLKSSDLTTPQVFHMVVSQGGAGSSSSCPGGGPPASASASPAGAARNPLGRTPLAPASPLAPARPPLDGTSPAITPPTPATASPAVATPATASPAVATPALSTPPPSSGPPAALSPFPTSHHGLSPATPYAGLGCYSPQVQAVYSAAYAAAFAALSPPGSRPPGTPPHVVAVPVPTMSTGVFMGGVTPMLTGPGGMPGAFDAQHGYLYPPGAALGGVGGYQGMLFGVPPQHAPVGLHPNPTVGPAGTAGGWGGRTGMGGNDAADANIAAAQAAVANGDPVAAAAAAAAAAAGGRRVHVMQIHIDLKLILKLSVIVFLMSQGASNARLALYVVVATLVYLAQTGALAPITRQLFGAGAEGNAGGFAGAGGVGGAGADARMAGGAGRGLEGGGGGNGGVGGRRAPPGPRTSAVLPGMRHGMPTTWVGELKVLVCGFLASLLPSWQPPELYRHRPPAPPPLAAEAPVAPSAPAPIAAGDGERPHQD